MIYFDYAATTFVDDEVLESYTKLLKTAFANSSSSHLLGVQADKYLLKAREAIAFLLKVEAKEIIFTSGATESNNLAIKGIAYARQKKGKHFITSNIEHPSVINAFKYLEEQGYEVTYLEVDKEGKITLEKLEKSIRSDTILVSIQHVNNELGTINEIKKISEVCKRYKILFHCDIVQSIAKLDVDFSLFDLASVSGHKIFGLKGCGFLFLRKSIKVTPLLHGGNQEDGIRSGTVNWPAIVSLAKTLRLGLEKKEEHYNYVKNIFLYLYDELNNHKEIVVNSSKKGSPYILNFAFKKLQGEVVMHALEEVGIIVSTTSACASKKKAISPVVLAVTKNDVLAANAIRVSLSYHNTMEEAEIFIKELKKIIIRMSKE